MHSISSGREPGSDLPQPHVPIAEQAVPEKSLAHDWLPNWRRLAVISLLFALFVFCSNLALDYLLLVHRDSPVATVEVSDALAALLAGVLFYRILDAGRRRRKLILQRLETIDQMNHHIRNALQVISFTVHANQEHAQEVANIDRAVNRIQWALREILPKM
ncbi:MAG TPA: hypothetical protein VLC12_01220 [Terriglobales bacterium]|nr:hypothetical protein [Terriglobales bacterium]